jgi:hypothetical protein
LAATNRNYASTGLFCGFLFAAFPGLFIRRSFFMPLKAKKLTKYYNIGRIMSR